MRRVVPTATLTATAALAIAQLAATHLHAEPHASAPSNRFALASSSLESRASTTSDDRFRLSAQLQRRGKPAVSEAFGLRLQAKLVKDTSGTCVVPLLLFSNGFESSG